MSQQKTHRLVKDPQISARYLADYMAASEQARRTIVRRCKYQAIARVVQHDEAKAVVSEFIRDREDNIVFLTEKAQRLRDRLADDDFDRDLYDHNADYIDRFARAYPLLNLPKADIEAAGKTPAINLHGVKVTVEIHFRLRRLTKTNEVRIGAGMLRYLKGKSLAEDVAAWQSAFLYGYLNFVGVDDGAKADHNLCLTIDVQGGVCHPAPTNSVSRFHNMEAACASIAERWANVASPPNAVF
jgi:hypothetical protein